MDWIGSAGVIVALAFGIVAWLQGRAAGRRAERADEKAERLEQRFTGLVGDVEAIKSAAVQTRELAEDANEIARGAAMGVHESHYVEWHGQWESHAYVLTNGGRDEALNVRGSVTIDGYERDLDAQRVGPGDQVRLDFHEVVQKLTEEASERRARAARRPMGTLPSYELPGSTTPGFDSGSTGTPQEG